MLNCTSKILAISQLHRIVGLLVVLWLPAVLHAGVFVGAQVCGECHEAQALKWRQSDHYQAMLPADDSTVLGAFDSKLEAHDQTYRLFKRKERFMADMPMQNGADNKTFEIRYTFGHRPLQQYLVEMSGGRLQALNVAWDSRRRTVGGQRWFHLRDEMPADSPFHFSRSLQNWNSNCAACHSTGVSKSIAGPTGEYQTTFAESNVACESCHGPGSDHVNAARNGLPLPALRPVPRRGQWTFADNAAIAGRIGTSDRQFIDTCGGCHARRSQIAALDPAGTFATQFELSLIEPPLYHADGQIRDEVFVLGSFMQSKMYQQGVTCGDCHDPHSGKLRREGNSLCAGCHNPGVYQQTAHLRHDEASVGAQCVNCHMPETVYMQVDARRDHHFGLPDPLATITLGVPNACNQCHQDKSPEWALQKMGKQPSVNQFATLQSALVTRDPLIVPQASEYLLDKRHPAIRRASILANLPLTDDSLRVASAILQEEPEVQDKGQMLDATLMRASAVSLLAEAPLALRQWMLTDSLKDPSLSVRLRATRALLEAVTQDGANGHAVLAALPGYRDALAVGQDQASGQTALAVLELALGNIELAVNHFNRALVIEPHFLPARLNLADLYRSQGREEDALRELAEAVRLAPDSGAAQHSYGLALIRSGDRTTAMPHLANATRQADQTPGYHYVYAVALDSVSRTDHAIRLLSQASTLWPNQYDLLVLEVIYREKTGMLQGIQQTLGKLARLAPEDPNVQHWQVRYGVE